MVIAFSVTMYSSMCSNPKIYDEEEKKTLKTDIKINEMSI